MEKGGRGGQRVACARVSERFSKPKSVCERGRRGMSAHTPALFCFPPPDRDWTSLTDLLASPHTCPHRAFILSDRSDAAQPLHPRSRSLFPRRKAELLGARSMFCKCKYMVLHIRLPACIR